jgi:hypothetical protein
MTLWRSNEGLLLTPAFPKAELPLPTQLMPSNQFKASGRLRDVAVTTLVPVIGAKADIVHTPMNVFIVIRTRR